MGIRETDESDEGEEVLECDHTVEEEQKKYRVH